MRLGVVWRALLVLLLDAVTLLLLSQALDGFVLDGAANAIGAAALIGLLNALVWPALARFALPLTVLTLGLGALVLNGALVTIAIDLLPGAEIGGVFEGTVVTIAMAAVTAIVYALFAIDEDESWHRNVVRRGLRRREQTVVSEVPGVVFLEIDGLAHDILHRALSDGSAPNLAAWLRCDSHRLRKWETDWSSQTGACQAGLLHGDNDDMPAFRWWEKERGAAIVTNHPRDAEELERRHSDGRGLLHADGASRANIVSGDAPHSMLTMSTALHRRRPIGKDYTAYFARPYAVARTFVLVLAEVVRERRAARAQVRDDVRPRIARSRSYA
ncbi:MAG TPA: phage holin family protein, partial [Solirubrobacterales bacterium]|nr:phage holin family protein [Solirubrobacterales bacterium]